MSWKGLRRVGLFLLSILVIIAIAYVLGMKTATAVQDWKADRQRARQTEAVLKEMGTGLTVGKVLPDAVLADLKGREIRLSDILCDRSVVVIFSPECSFSRAELAAIKGIGPKPEDETCFILISAADQTEVRYVIEKTGLDCPLLIDRNGEYGKRLGIKAVPMNFVVDRALTIVDVISGVMPNADIADIVEQSRGK